MMNIVLIGFMGSGKTTVGRALSAKSDMEFLDTDALIEGKEDCKISTIFTEKGEGDISRPLLMGEDKLRRVEELLSSRRELYESTADRIIDVDDLSVEEIVDSIMKDFT